MVSASSKSGSFKPATGADNRAAHTKGEDNTSAATSPAAAARKTAKLSASKNGQLSPLSPNPDKEQPHEGVASSHNATSKPNSSNIKEATTGGQNLSVSVFPPSPKWINGDAPSPAFSTIFGPMSDENFIISLPSPKDLEMFDLKNSQNLLHIGSENSLDGDCGYNAKNGGGCDRNRTEEEAERDSSDLDQKDNAGETVKSPASESFGTLIQSDSSQFGNYGWGANNERLQSWLTEMFDPNRSSPFPIVSLSPSLIESHEQTFKLFDRYTCGILSIKDGPTENPWRTVMWPLAQDHGALYHAVGAMTKFHTSRNDPDLRSQAVYHMKESFHLLANGLSNKTLPPDIALATTLSLAFAEAWDRHISTGIAHLRGAASMLKQLLKKHRNEPLPPWLQFLFNAWLYLDVCARLTAESAESESSIVEICGDEQESSDEEEFQEPGIKIELSTKTFEGILNSAVFEDTTSSDESVTNMSAYSNGKHDSGSLEQQFPKSEIPRRQRKNSSSSSSSSKSSFKLKENLFSGQRDEVDPLLGCAQTLFPLIGKVATLVQKVRKSEKNSLSIVSEAVELKNQLEGWNTSLSSNMTFVEDPTWDLNSCLATAESYRYASLLYLHQAVPEVPSLSCHELAEKVMMLLASIPKSSRTAVVHIFPLLIAGCEAHGDERDWVRSRWKVLSERMWIGNVDRTVEIVNEVWTRKDIRRKEREERQRHWNHGSNYASKGIASNGGSSNGNGGPDFSLSARRSSRDIALSISSRVSEVLGSGRANSDSERSGTHDNCGNYDDEGIKDWSHWSTVMKEWGWEVLLG